MAGRDVTNGTWGKSLELELGQGCMHDCVIDRDGGTNRDWVWCRNRRKIAPCTRMTMASPQQKNMSDQSLRLQGGD